MTKLNIDELHTNIEIITYTTKHSPLNKPSANTVTVRIIVS